MYSKSSAVESEQQLVFTSSDDSECAFALAAGFAEDPYEYEQTNTIEAEKRRWKKEEMEDTDLSIELHVSVVGVQNEELHDILDKDNTKNLKLVGLGAGTRVEGATSEAVEKIEKTIIMNQMKQMKQIPNRNKKTINLPILNQRLKMTKKLKQSQQMINKK